MTNESILQEWVDLIARLNPAQLVKYTPSDAVKTRVQELVFKLNAGNLTAKEESELRLHEQFENLIGLARARAVEI